MCTRWTQIPILHGLVRAWLRERNFSGTCLIPTCSHGTVRRVHFDGWGMRWRQFIHAAPTWLPGDKFAKKPPDGMTANSDTFPDRTSSKRCAKCGAAFLCGPQAGMKDCWCNELPPLHPTADGSDCLCRPCLSNEISTQALRPTSQEARAPSLVEGQDYYREGSAVVFTAGYHLRRGYCCGNGCRHCPYTESQPGNRAVKLN